MLIVVINILLVTREETVTISSLQFLSKITSFYLSQRNLKSSLYESIGRNRPKQFSTQLTCRKIPTMGRKTINLAANLRLPEAKRLPFGKRLVTSPSRFVSLDEVANVSSIINWSCRWNKWGLLQNWKHQALGMLYTFSDFLFFFNQSVMRSGKTNQEVFLKAWWSKRIAYSTRHMCFEFIGSKWFRNNLFFR